MSGCCIKNRDLKNVRVISDGQKVNGSELVEGLEEGLPAEVIITGGFAGDGARFNKTLVGLNESPIEGRIIVIGFYGDHLSVNFDSVGGWDSFGPERLITKATENIRMNWMVNRLWISIKCTWANLHLNFRLQDYYFR